MNEPGIVQKATRILVVDDDPAMRLLTSEAISDLCEVVDQAEDGVVALELFEQNPADLVLLDVRMPRLDGYAVCEQLRELPGGKQASIVMVTGLDDHDSIRRAYDLGATDFITKPINWTILPERVRFLLRSKHTLQALENSEARLAKAQEIASLGHWEWDIRDNRLDWSEQIFRIFGMRTGDFDQSLESFMQRVHPEDRSSVEHAVEAAMQSESPYSLDHRIVRPDGEVRTVHEQAELQRDINGEPIRMLGTVHDITERQKAAERIHRLAYYDSLTGLPNRHLFREFAEISLYKASQHNECVALLHLDIDRFSRINATLGHNTGDLLLRSIGKRVSNSAQAANVLANRKFSGADAYQVARLGADEFLVLLRSDGVDRHLIRAAEQLREDLSRPIRADQGEYVLTASIGIALYPQDCDDLDTLLRYADAGMHSIKKAGGNGFRFYSQEMDSLSHRRLSLETQLHHALERGGLELYYQPQIHLENEQLTGFEALLRWRKTDGELVSPGDFIPLAEESGLIVPIGDWVIHEACRQLARWRDEGRPRLPLAINLSARQFTETSLMQRISQALAENHLDPHLLELELTESMIMEDAQSSSEKLRAFHESGLRIAVDDFGTGYSSMSYLKRFPLDLIKIDQSFIRDLSTDATDAAIVRAIIAMGKALGVNTLAEGVENPQQRQILLDAGCLLAQGFYYSKPLPAEQVWLQYDQQKSAKEQG